MSDGRGVAAGVAPAAAQPPASETVSRSAQRHGGRLVCLTTPFGLLGRH